MARLSSLPQTCFILATVIGTVLPLGRPARALQYNPPNRGAPSRTWDAGSRTGACGNLTAVQPTQTNWGETLQERPTFGIYVSEPAQNITFELRQERTQEIVHQATFAQVDGPGISLYTLPETAPALAANQPYRWQISVECAQFSTDNIEYTDSRQADGIIFRRVASDELTANLVATPETEHPALLAANGLWYDTIHALLLQQAVEPAEPDAWTQAWQTLLLHPMVQLNKLMDATLVECCLSEDATLSAVPQPCPTTTR
ncbi:MAG: DUF928 domain-containing protein [Cyanobacteria bacterium J06642_11]